MESKDNIKAVSNEINDTNNVKEEDLAEGGDTQEEVYPESQNELTQLAETAEEESCDATNLSALCMPWGRLIPCSSDSTPFDLLPRSSTSDCVEGCGSGDDDEGNSKKFNYLGLENICPCARFNEYVIGRSLKCDVTPCKQQEQSISNGECEKQEIHDWVHSMISNKHCHIYCLLKTQPNLSMEVYVEDSSGNGTLINATLLRRGQRRLLHTGDHICLVNPKTLTRKVSSQVRQTAIQHHYSYVFINLHQQHAVNSRKRPIVDARSTKSPLKLYKQQHHLTPPQTSATKQPRHIEQYYDMRDLLGTGTAGEVRRAIHRTTGQQHAVKVINVSKHQIPSAIQAEVDILRSLDHPYIVKFIDSFTSPYHFYLVMEMIHGGDLFYRIQEKGLYDEMEARRIMRRIFSAVYYLHQHRDIVHRDLKPENILLLHQNTDVQVKLTDFGLAKSITKDGLKTFCGTPQYFAPEVLRRSHTITQTATYGKPADMWSLGIILYILLSGTPPFDVSHSIDTVAHAKITYTGKRWKNISKSAINLVKQLLIYDAQKRIDIERACSHPWILVEDGDTHTHPLDDPVLLNCTWNKDRQNLNSHSTSLSPPFPNKNYVPGKQKQAHNKEKTNVQLSFGFTKNATEKTKTTASKKQANAKKIDSSNIHVKPENVSSFELDDDKIDSDFSDDDKDIPMENDSSCYVKKAKLSS